jgi:hypothetical protein
MKGSARTPNKHTQRANEEKLREAAALNNLRKVRKLLASDTNPNAQDEVNHQELCVSHVAHPEFQKECCTDK